MQKQKERQKSQPQKSQKSGNPQAPQKPQKQEWEPYINGALVAGVWQLVFLNLGMGIAWWNAVFISVVTAMVFFIVSVLMFEVRALKGKL